MDGSGTPGLRGRVGAWVESARVQRGITALILANAAILGLETWPWAMERAGRELALLDRAILAVFVLELGLKFFARGLRFFRSPWNVFDLAVVGVALVPATGSLSVLRAFRVLRVLRLLSTVPSLRFVVEALLRALPGIGAIAGLLGVFFYVFAVMATKLFGAEFPEWFGSLRASVFTLFQVMTLEGWADISREATARFPLANLFFIPFILVATFTILNLFISIIVNAMTTLGAEEQAKVALAVERGEGTPEQALRAEMRALRAEIAELRGALRPAP